MTSLNDIPIVGNVVNRVEDAAVDATILRLRYLLCYKTLIKVLKTEVDKLKIEEDALSRKAVAERDDGKVIKEHVLKWQQDVENIKEVVEHLFESYQQRPSWMCFKDIPFAKPASRFRLGKQAAENAITVTELTNSGKDFLANEIAHHPPKENVPVSDTPYQSFQSRQEAYGKLWEALIKEDGHPVLGIYGMPGVGKTRMMEQAWKEAKEKGIFSKVTRANVGGEKLDVIKLQGQIAGYLDCHLESEDNEVLRASQLKKSLINGGKTLVILDDVWDIISLNKIGIPFGDVISMGCKILFTSRKRDICLGNNCEDPIEITTLTEDEAWHMFEEAVGTFKIQSLREPSLAEKVCTKCGRLPLLISAVGKAVKFMTENSWKDALSELENCRYEEIAGMEPGVSSCLRLSFDKLTEAGKTCLLLCSLFPEDADINIKELSNLATGSQLLNRQKNIAGVVDILRSSSLLLEGEDDDTVKLHDIIRDVARNIAAKDPKYAFLSIRCSLGLPDINTECHTLRLLHLDLEKANVCFPNDLVCPDLHTLWLQCNDNTQKLSSRFSEGLTDLIFLLQRTNFLELQLSIHRLENLRMIIIDGCDIDEAFFDSVPQSLQTLCIKNSCLPSPLDLSKLKNLRKLELLHMDKIEMVPNSISSLSGLEELYIPRGFTIWEDVDADADARSIYVELNKLTWLRKLTISLPYSQSCLNGDIMSNLQEFNIYVGFNVYDSLYKKSISFKGNHIESGWMALVEVAEEVCVDRVEGFFNYSKQSEALANVKYLKIEYCDDMDHLISLPVDGRNQQMAYFCNLCFLTIDNCKGLTYLFSASVANCIRKLQELKVTNCDAIEEIICPIDDGEVIISFPKLKELHMESLSSLNSFCSTHKVAFPSLEKLKLEYLGNASEIWGKGIYHQEDSSSFSQLKVLTVKYCEKLENVIPVTLVNEFNNLEEVEIEDCKSLKTVFQNSSIATNIENLNQTDERSVMFSSLKKLFLHSLPNIKSFWSYGGGIIEVNSNRPCKVSLPNLEKLRVSGCKSSGLGEEIEVGIDDDSPPKLIELMLRSDSEEVEFIPSQWLRQFQNLELLWLVNWMWHGESLFNSTTLTLYRLRELGIDNCKMIGPSLFITSFFKNFQQLQILEVIGCDMLEEIVEEEDIGMDDEKTISLPCLHILVLYNLPSLKCFSSCSSYAFNMPLLKSVYLRECPRMYKFTSSLPINTPPFLCINGEYNSDLNRYVREEVLKKR